MDTEPGGTGTGGRDVPRPERPGPAPAEGPARILVVDDNEDCRMALRTFLEASGYRVYEARGGAEAVSRARNVRPDLILMDLMMPEVDGLEATRRIRSEPSLSDTRIVAISAMEGARQPSLAAGCDACVIKPLDMGRFPGRVEEWLGPRG